MSILKLERITKLGRLGEDLVAERLHHEGFTHIHDVSDPRVTLDLLNA